MCFCLIFSLFSSPELHVIQAVSRLLRKTRGSNLVHSCSVRHEGEIQGRETGKKRGNTVGGKEEDSLMVGKDKKRDEEFL